VISSGAVVCNIKTITSSAATFGCFVSNTASASDSDFSFLCHGAK
jgi:hypothetical protein